MKGRVLVARLSHETNTFAAGVTAVEAFLSHREGTPLQGMMEVLEQRHYSSAVSVVAAAYPSAVVSSDAVQQFVQRITQDIADEQHHLCAVLLDLHGAMAAQHHPNCELLLLQSLRNVCSLPIGVAYDLHGNIDAHEIALLDVAVAYKTYPHVDMVETGRRAAQLTLDIVESGVRPRKGFARPNVMSHTLRSATVEQDSAMYKLVEEAKQLEATGKVLSCSIFAGFSLADVPQVGMSVVVIGGDDPQAIADRLSAKAWEMRRDFVYVSEPLDVSLASAPALRSAQGPVLLLDHGDNVMSGAASASTTALHAAMRLLPGQLLSGPLCDPEFVASLSADQVGSEVTLLREDGFSYRGTLRLLCDGKFRVTGPIFRGVLADMGKTARIDSANGTLVSFSSASDFHLIFFLHTRLSLLFRLSPLMLAFSRALL